MPQPLTRLCKDRVKNLQVIQNYRLPRFYKWNLVRTERLTTASSLLSLRGMNKVGESVGV
ncbi:hypothetical protein [Helicobacter rodentium]|uniref:hypothetical protein n=1 Tax=Helicobacter rodentium TaxID=59617 RepID=UPI0023F461EF|nr:hypothetical protein [Helicobacter rodentium]